MKPAIALSDKERFPLLEDLSFLNQLRQDGRAPLFTFQSGDRLTGEHLKKVKAYEEQVLHHKLFWKEGGLPHWMDGFVRFCVNTVPFYRGRGLSFSAQPTIRRSDLQAAPWLFASSESVLDDLLVYQTSGTTGPAMDVLFDPATQACWLPQLQSILHLYGIGLSTDPGKVVIALICNQQSTLTYASLSTYLGGAGVLKVNLNPADWKEPSDRTAFLEKYNPEVLTGDPFAFAALMELNPNIRPKVMVSSAMKLTQSLRKELEKYFQCPVLDVYSLTECRMIAFAEGEGHRAIRPDLYLEVFHETKDIVLPCGERGELVVTGGNNPFLPLLRYRTGDFCSLEIRGGIPYLSNLEARKAVAFYTKEGRFVNSVDVSRALNGVSLAGFTLHQRKDYSLTLTGWGDEAGLEETIRQILRSVFSPDGCGRIVIRKPSDLPRRKMVSYTSEFEL